VLDRLGPGGSGRFVEDREFIGFPNGLSGADLAMRSVLQMLKFGATMVAPVEVESIKPKSLPDEFCITKARLRVTLHARTVLIAAGVRWRRLEASARSGSNRRGSITPAHRWRRCCMTRVTSAVVGAGNSADRR